MEYDISESTVESILPETSEIGISLNKKNIDEGVEYEIEEDSDEEENNSSDLEYDIVEDSSGLKTTICAFPPVSQLRQNSTLGPQTVVGENLRPDNRSQNMSLTEVRAILDELEEDPTEAILMNISRNLKGPIPQALEKLADSAPKASLEDPPNDFGKSPLEVPYVSETIPVDEGLISGSRPQTISLTEPPTENCAQLYKIRSEPIYNSSEDYLEGFERAHTAFSRNADCFCSESFSKRYAK